MRIDDAGDLRCWNCGSKNLETRRRTGSKLFGSAVGVVVAGPFGVAGALAAKKRLRCQGCGEYNDVGKPEPFTQPVNRQRHRPSFTGLATFNRQRNAARANAQAERKAEYDKAPGAAGARLAQERFDKDRLAAERAEIDRLARAVVEKERLKKERLERERNEAD